MLSSSECNPYISISLAVFRVIVIAYGNQKLDDYRVSKSLQALQVAEIV